MWIGAINWGLMGAFDFNLVHMILGSVSIAERVVYVLVGLSALFMLMKGMCKGCKMCMGKECNCGPESGNKPASGGAMGGGM